MMPGETTPFLLHGVVEGDVAYYCPWLEEEPGGGEARIHVNTPDGLLCSFDLARRDASSEWWVTPRDVQWAIRHLFGIPMSRQTLLHESCFLDSDETLQELWPNREGFQELSITLIQSMSPVERQEHDDIRRWLRLLPQRRVAFPIAVVIGTGFVTGGGYFNGLCVCALPEELWEADVRSLALVRMPRLEIIPWTVRQLVNLRTLTLDDLPSLHDLPSDVFECVSLDELILARLPCVSTVSDCIDQLVNLKVLVLDSLGIVPGQQIVGSQGGHLLRLPPEIGALRALRQLSLCGHPWLEELPPALGQLGNLVVLQLEELGIYKIPPELGSLRNLSQLHVLCCPRVRSLPRGILVQTSVLKGFTQLLVHSNSGFMTQLIYPPSWERWNFAVRPRCGETPTVDAVMSGDVPALGDPRRPLHYDCLEILKRVLSGTIWPPWRDSDHVLRDKMRWADALSDDSPSTWRVLPEITWRVKIGRLLEDQYPGDNPLVPCEDLLEYHWDDDRDDDDDDDDSGGPFFSERGSQFKRFRQR